MKQFTKKFVNLHLLIDSANIKDIVSMRKELIDLYSTN